MNGTELRTAIEGELGGNLLPFWRQRSVDPRTGGFIAEMSADGVVRPNAHRGLILTARLLWTFSALVRRFHDDRDLDLASRALGDLEGHFRDREHDGYHWRLSSDGRPEAGPKKVYGQAFCIYALSEYHLATGSAAALDSALRVAAALEEHARDQLYGGFLEARANAWSPTGNLRLGDTDMDAPKSMNTHLHLMEAYTNLLRASDDPPVARRLYELVRILLDHIVRPDGHLDHFFDERWRPLADSYTYGHDIEASWLLSEAAGVLGDRPLTEETRRVSRKLADAVVSEGDGQPGIPYEGRDGRVFDGTRDWWCQAEAVVGFWNAFQLTGNPGFAERAGDAWKMIDSRLVDRVHGDWHWRVLADGSVDRSLPKVSEWKGPYHSIRMCLELIDRIDDDHGGR